MNRLMIVLLMVFVFGTISSNAKGVPDYFVVSGDDMFPMMLHMDTPLIFDWEARITPAPEIDSVPYMVHSYVRLENNDLYEIEFSPLEYYPEEGLIYFVGAMERGIFQPYDHKWYAVLPEYAAMLNDAIDSGRDIYAMQGEMLPQLLRLLTT